MVGCSVCRLAISYISVPRLLKPKNAHIRIFKTPVTTGLRNNIPGDWELEHTVRTSNLAKIFSATGPRPGNTAAIFKTLVASGDIADGYSQGDENYDDNSDASYSSIDTDSYKRTEASDAKGNIRGQYSYSSQAGRSHGLRYIAGEGTGFVVNRSDGTEGFGARAGPISSKTSSSYYTEPTADTRSNRNNYGSYSVSKNDQSRQEPTDSYKNVRGSYSSKIKGDEAARRVDFSADSATGFVATGSHPPISSESLGRATSLEYSSSGKLRSTTYDQRISSSERSRPSSYTFSSGTGRPQGVVGTNGSYSFAYNAGDSSRQESADVQNNVRGTFTFKSKDDGKTRRVDYEAGAATGFIAKGSHLPSVFNPLSSTSNGGYSGVLSSNSPVGDYYSTFSDSSGEKESSGDASYSFSYNAGEQSRQESSDAQGNINGQYSFIGTDGVQRKVDYSAGPGKGFIAKVGSSASPASFRSFSQTPVTSYSSEAGISSTGVQRDGSYSFSYNAGDHSRQESGDAQNNVRGTYSFRAKDDGQTRRINYEAGAATGFIAKGSDLPTAVPPYGTGNNFSSFSLQPTVRLNPTEVGGLASSSGIQRDGSYSFSYNTADQSRQESGDARNNVRGSFTFKAKDDGQTRRADYKAGANIGFTAKQTHIPEGQTAPLSVLDATGTVLSHTKHFALSPRVDPVISEALKPSDDSYSTYSAGENSRKESSDSRGNNNSHDNRSSGDASYSYSYKTDSSSKEETSDAQGNVVGTFSFLGGDGVIRNVHYTSRGNEGFVVSGEHLPKGVTSDTIGASA